MIILCSDYVGFEIIKYLIDSNEHISYLVLDSSDRNNFNSKITNYYKKQFPDNQIYFEDTPLAKIKRIAKIKCTYFIDDIPSRL